MTVTGSEIGVSGLNKVDWSKVAGSIVAGPKPQNIASTPCRAPHEIKENLQEAPLRIVQHLGLTFPGPVCTGSRVFLDPLHAWVKSEQSTRVTPP